MPTRGQRRMLIMTIMLVMVSMNAASAQWKAPRGPGFPDVPRLSVPPLVRLTGTLHPPDEHGAPVHALTVYIGDRQWNFWLTDIDNMSGPPYGWLTLTDLFPRELRFSGPDEVLVPLQRPDIAGKPVSVEDRLYTVHRKLVVTAIGEPVEKTQ